MWTWCGCVLILSFVSSFGSASSGLGSSAGPMTGAEDGEVGVGDVGVCDVSVCDDGVCDVGVRDLEVSDADGSADSVGSVLLVQTRNALIISRQMLIKISKAPPG